MSGAADVDRVEVVFFDQPVKVDVGKGLAGIRAPVTQQTRLYVVQYQRLSQQGVFLQIQHPQAKIEAGPPVRVDLAQLGGTERGPFDCRASPAVGDGLVRAKRFVGSSGSFCHTDAPDLGERRLVGDGLGRVFTIPTPAHA